MKAKYGIGQRLSFIARNKCAVGRKLIIGKWTHHVGYVKQIRRSLLGVRYVMIKSKSDGIYIIPQRDVIGVVEKRDSINKSHIINEDGNIG